MRNTVFGRASYCLGTLILLTHCSGSSDSDPDAAGFGGGTATSGGTNGMATGGATLTGGATSSVGGANVGGGSGLGGSSNSGGIGTGGTTSGGASSGGMSNVGGQPATGGTSSGGVSNVGGQPATGGTSSGGMSNVGGQPPTGGTSAGGSSAGGSSTGGSSTGGVTGDGGTPASGGAPPDLDENGKGIAQLGDSTDVPQDYLRLGEIRILNNNWGSEDLGCFAPTSTMSVFVDDGGSFGWNFNRGDCADNGNPGAMPPVQPDTSHPDFPQVEFGIHPFGIGDADVTSPEFSSTTLLPLQLKDITSASVTLDNLNITLGGRSSWNLAMEFWLSEGDPRQPSGSVDVHTELMAWWGWNQGRWPCNSNPDRVEAGQGYTLCHQDDAWAGGRWRYYQFRAGDGSDGNISQQFSGTINVKAFLDYLMTKGGYHGDLWLTRMEVGSEIDDMTDGRVSMNGITFEVNGESRSEVIIGQ